MLFTYPPKDILRRLIKQPYCLIGIIMTCCSLPVWAASITIGVQTNLHDSTNFEFEAPFISSWGSTGTTQGKFNFPNGIAIDSAGNVYVVDTNNHRVQKFDSAGNFLLMWGKGVKTGFAGGFEICTADDNANNDPINCAIGREGFATGQMHNPAGIAIDSNDNIYIADRVNDRIIKYSNVGAYLATYNQIIDNPVAIAIDSNDNIYIAESNQARIVKFNSSGVFERMWGWGVKTGATTYEICLASDGGCSNFARGGTGPGQLVRPIGIAIDSNDDIIVANTSGTPLIKYTTDGAHINTFVSPAQGVGIDQLDSPFGIEVDANDNIFVADLNSRKIKMFDSNANFITTWGRPGATPGNFSTAYDIAIHPQGEIYITDRTQSNRVQRFAAPNFSLDDATPDDNDGINQSITFNSVAAPSYRYRQLKKGGWLLSDITCTGATSSVITYGGDAMFDAGDDEVTIDVNGDEDINCVFTNTKSSITLIKKTPSADQTNIAFAAQSDNLPEFVGMLAEPGSAASQTNRASGFGVGNDGSVYSAEREGHRIQKFDPQGNFEAIFGWGVNTGTDQLEVCTPATLPCQSGIFSAHTEAINDPLDVDVDSNGNIYILEDKNRIQKFDSDYNFIAAWGKDVNTDSSGVFEVCTAATMPCYRGKAGAGAGEMSRPTTLIVTDAGEVIVSDSSNFRINVYSLTGAFLRTWGFGVKTGASTFEVCTAADVPCQKGLSGSGSGQLRNPRGLVIDSFGKLNVVDGYRGNVLVYNTNGSYDSTWSSSGLGNGELDFAVGIGMDHKGNFYIGDVQGIQKFDSARNFIGKYSNGGREDEEIGRIMAIAVTPAGKIHVTDESTNRIQSFFWGEAQLESMSAVEDNDGVISQTTFGYKPGAYTVTEDVPLGYVLTDINCINGTSTTYTYGGDDAFSVGDTALGIDLALGDHVTCTFFNAIDDDDDDDDLVLDVNDNCQYVANTDQKDLDGDDDGDACDTDDDGDATPDVTDTDNDNDGILDISDPDPRNFLICGDSDNDQCDDCSIGNDGLGAGSDNDPANDGLDSNGDGECNLGDDDDDGDGLLDGEDNCPIDINPDQRDGDGDGIGDACDPVDDTLCITIVSSNNRLAIICL